MKDTTFLIDKIMKLKEVLMNSKDLGVDMDDTLKKIEKIIDTISGNEIDIALIGSFSDGKTSAIAGLMGQVLANMKIAPDESSDEIIVYQNDFLGKHFRIVDTPGLFGTKEKEFDGVNVKFSDLTARYLSEAHIVIYVCNATNPLKDSHVSTIKYIMKELKKIESSIFVINKMDDAGYTLTDEEDFCRGKEIKTNTLKMRLKESLDLSESELDHLNIVCISADPKRRGVENWLNNDLEGYLSRSHINELKQALNDVIMHSDKDNLKRNVEYAGIKDVLINLGEEIKIVLSQYSKMLNKLQENSEELSSEMSALERHVKEAKSRMIRELDILQSDVIDKIKGAGVKTIGTVIQNDLGVGGDSVTLYKLERNINNILSKCFSANVIVLENKAVKIEQMFNAESLWVEKNINKGAGFIGKIKIDANMVKNARDMFAKGVKFKPYGAIKMGEKITKFLGMAGLAISAAVEVYQWYKEYKAVIGLDEIKEELTNQINEIFADISKSFNDDEEYYKQYASNYIELRNVLNNRKHELQLLGTKIERLECLKDNLHLLFNDINNIEFAGINKLN